VPILTAGTRSVRLQADRDHGPAKSRTRRTSWSPRGQRTDRI